MHLTRKVVINIALEDINVHAMSNRLNFNMRIYVRKQLNDGKLLIASKLFTIIADLFFFAALALHVVVVHCAKAR